MTAENVVGLIKDGQPQVDADGQPLTEPDPGWFQTRPSAVDYDALGSAASQLGPNNPDLVADDPAALNQSRVILAAMGASADLPARPFRAARLHLQVSGTESPGWQVKLVVASAADGAKIPAASAAVPPPPATSSPSSPEGAVP